MMTVTADSDTMHNLLGEEKPLGMWGLCPNIHYRYSVISWQITQMMVVIMIFTRFIQFY